MAHGEIAKNKKKITVVMPIKMWDEIVEATAGNISASSWIITACQEKLNILKAKNKPDINDELIEFLKQYKQSN